MLLFARLSTCLGMARAIVILLFIGVTATVFTTGAHANSKYAGIVIDHKTGRVLYQDNADKIRYPASLTKIMTLYIVFEELEAGRLTYDTRMRVSSYAASRPPSKIHVKAGGRLRVKDAIGALVTKSANDASVVLAEHIAGSEAAFAKRMTRTARSLGMKKTTFRNANGLPNSRQRTTARDMATLGRAIQDRFPRYYKWFKIRRYTIGSKTYSSHNRLLGSVSGVDGIKTGYIHASGFNLITSVKRDDREIVAVVMGGKTGWSRDAHMRDLISRTLHKARKGRRRAPLVASRSGTSSFATAYASVPTRNIPKPVARPATVAAAGLASGLTGSLSTTRQVTAQAPARSTPIPLPGIRPREDVKIASLGSALPVPTSRIDPAIALTATGTAPIPPAPVGKTASQQAPASSEPTIGRGAPAGTDWVIQIGAMPNRGKAVELLQRAMSQGGSAVNGATPFTETAVVKKRTYHRARFAGFSGKRAAQRACQTLEKRRFACYAIRG